ncbi:DUF2203 domain-containing protein [soil metagenome]
MDSAFERLFTVEEANALIPRLREILDELALHRDALREKAPDMEPILDASTGNGGGRAGSEYGAEAYNLYLAVERIRDLGVVLKDLDMGLLDFPHEREGRIVFLCWRPSEEKVAYWHDLDAGYAGRQPL